MKITSLIIAIVVSVLLVACAYDPDLGDTGLGASIEIGGYTPDDTVALRPCNEEELQIARDDMSSSGVDSIGSCQTDGEGYIVYRPNTGDEGVAREALYSPSTARDVGLGPVTREPPSTDLESRRPPSTRPLPDETAPTRNCSVDQRRIIYAECDRRCGGGWFGARQMLDCVRYTENGTVGFIGSCRCWSGIVVVIDKYISLKPA